MSEGLQIREGMRGVGEMKCKQCKQPIVNPRSTSQQVCSMSCAIEYSKIKAERKAANDAKQVKREYRAAKVKAKTRSDWMREAQAAFNAFIRARDEREPCISCGRHHTGQYHAGHYLTVGARPELRFNEQNVHKQCSACNNYLHGNLINYRIELIRRIGIDEVEALEACHDPMKYTIPQLQEIKTLYKTKLKNLIKNS
jgi:Bacteriophage Lambda NinG protein.